MPYYVYILQSQSTGRYYCGHTENLERRISQHNDPEYGLTRTTKVFAGPWKQIWSYELKTRSRAMKLEKQIKKRGIGRFLSGMESAESRGSRD